MMSEGTATYFTSNRLWYGKVRNGKLFLEKSEGRYFEGAVYFFSIWREVGTCLNLVWNFGERRRETEKTGQLQRWAQARCKIGKCSTLQGKCTKL